MLQMEEIRILFKSQGNLSELEQRNTFHSNSYSLKYAEVFTFRYCFMKRFPPMGLFQLWESPLFYHFGKGRHVELFAYSVIDVFISTHA